ncbi:maternal protein exuperantia [Drosophila kikkawai]|uniref:Maternal protein exuperantia n=1 Tax=Drosophila kikkawai TaxID=30033 RepID=A0A6P4IP40_DROKI|nr:maternal protein exuperantia [Drosophila kikkawai]
MGADNIDATATADQSSSGFIEKDTLPVGKYLLVGIDIDTTGRRLIDEIVQLAAYTPTDNFQQYIMPYMNLNPAARQRHQVRVISIGFYRMLKSMQTFKIIKSKSEIAALKDFLNWLEQLAAKAGSGYNGIVLLYHEERKFIPYMILESLKKYGLIERFSKTVTAFANSLHLAKASIGDTNIKNYSLRKLAKLLSKSKEDNTAVSSSSASGSGSVSTSTEAIDSTTVDNNSSSSSNNNFNEKRSAKNGVKFERDEFEGNASVRAKMAFHVALQIANAIRKSEPESSETMENLFNALKPFAELVGSDVQELDTQNENLERQNSFRPVFLNYFKTALYHRVRAVKFRIVLAENGFDLNSLNTIWADKGTEGLDMALQSIGQLKAEDKTELIELLDSFFDPNKTTIKPVVKSNNNNNNNNRRRNRRNTNQPPPKNGVNTTRSTSTEFGAGGDKSQSVSSLPDSTTKSSSPNKTAGGRTQRKRNSRHSLSSGNEAKVTEGGASIKVELNSSAPAAIQPVAIAASN